MLIASSSMKNVFELFCAILIFVAVLAITYYTTKWISNYQNLQLKNSNIEVIETMRNASGKYIQIVRIANEYVVIAVCKDTVTFLTKLDEDSIQQLQTPAVTDQESFQEILKKLKKAGKRS